MTDANPVGGLITAGALVGTALTISVLSLFPDAHEELTDVEGGYVYHVDDRGGETNWGITKATARKHGYQGNMRDLPKAFADSVAYLSYWKPLSLDRIANKEDTAYRDLAVQMYKLSYHAGTNRAVRTLQRCLNVLNKDEELYRDIQVDGKMGRYTLGAFYDYRTRFGNSGVIPLGVCYNSLTGAFYVSISERRPRNQSFTRGWFYRIAD